MTLDGRAIANFILDECDAKDLGVTNLALQKLVYFCHAWSLVKLHRPLLKHQFEAWQYGPVLQYLYRDFKVFDRQPITIRAKKLNPLNGKSEVVGYALDEQTSELLKRVISYYGELSAGALVDLSHEEGGPWDAVWRHEGAINPGMKIDDELIRGYYSKVPAPF